ncbi:MAG: RNA-binding protein [Candidatus Marinimicrobia bacterium]|nr:RNA-binding protein [Candidatus Neomarinimicrobiota bacterium]MBL7059700.1 RNA-binding protein [Candidatus Neomarinimicrobiota bacterium]
MNIYVGNLPFKFSEQELSELFAEFGSVTKVQIITDKYTGRSKGFGFVEMSEKEDGEKAISELNDKEVHGRALKVNEARPREDRPARRPRY